MADDLKTLLALVLVFVPLSLLSIGGGASLLADMEHQSVSVHAWTTPRVRRSFCDIARGARPRDDALYPDRLEGRGLGGRNNGDGGALSAVFIARLLRGAAMGPLARLGLALGSRARSRTARCRPNAIRRDRRIARLARRACSLDGICHCDRIAAALAAPPPADIVHSRRSPVRAGWPERTRVRLRGREVGHG